MATATEKDIKARRKAQDKILAAANKQGAWRQAKYYRRHLQQAVCVVRRLGLVKNSVLVDAGFNPGKERGS